jgi:AraC-like DNA-binding protein
MIGGGGLLLPSPQYEGHILRPDDIAQLFGAEGDGLIHTESAWRRPAVLEAPSAWGWRAVASKWTDNNSATRVETADPVSGYYTLALALRKTNAAFSVSGSTVHDGDLSPGMIQISAPGDSSRAVFRAPCGFLHLFIAERFVLQCLENSGISAGTERPKFDRGFKRDVIVEQLIRSLNLPGMNAPTTGRLYVEGVCLAIIARIISTHHNRDASREKPKICPLPNWRLKRAVEYIDANIAEPITLAGVAKSTGLTRMYFAAQFRAATGLRPHEYILRRRVERAQDLMLSSDIALVETAFSVGFQTQAHFTTVFKRLVGQTPYKWREESLRHAGSIRVPRSDREADAGPYVKSDVASGAVRHAALVGRRAVPLERFISA